MTPMAKSPSLCPEKPANPIKRTAKTINEKAA
jgi:hypothetical protein